jgi:glycerophosphoryl diester phosphodiesterase
MLDVFSGRTIEADLRESADGAVVLSHDYVGGKTFKELESQGIVSLSSLLQLAKNRALLLLDLKDRYFCASQCANFQTMTWSMRRKMRAVKSVNL